ncbi:MAG: L-histidine N(alpha)-methyltransferase [Armatimonadetes bacterium]|nr:L-histidine N(alpha)-methyltransferase [Armatimonadota bacterium]
MSVASHPRLELVQPEQERSGDDFPAAVLKGLGRRPKALPCRFFYDAEGSRLFDEITQLSAYYLTRSEQQILRRNSETIAEALGDDVSLVELGGGNSAKTRLLIEAILNRQHRLRFTSVDISAEHLVKSAHDLLRRYKQLNVTAVTGEYRSAFAHLAKNPPGGPRAFLFLGSNIGNFAELEAIAFLSEIRRLMRPQDALLIGVDMQKERAIIEGAYNDPEGITERFNKNLLLRINRELGGRFDPSAFTHHAPYLPEEGRVEMRLISNLNQQVEVEALHRTFDFDDCESIHTEDSYKFTPDGFEGIASSAGFGVSEHWQDEKDWFRLYLLKPAAT